MFCKRSADVLDADTEIRVFVCVGGAECSGPESVLAVQTGSEQTEGREGELVEDLVAVSYMEDELDLETVGDIIAIIEEKVQITDPETHKSIIWRCYSVILLHRAG